MNALNEPVARKIARLFRLFGSNFVGEAQNAFAAMRRLVANEGLTFNDIAAVIENHQGEIEELKYSDADAAIIFAQGVEKGREEEARRKEQIAPTDYYDAGGQPRWDAIAAFCQKH